MKEECQNTEGSVSAAERKAEVSADNSVVNRETLMVSARGISVEQWWGRGDAELRKEQDKKGWRRQAALQKVEEGGQRGTR